MVGAAPPIEEATRTDMPAVASSMAAGDVAVGVTEEVVVAGMAAAAEAEATGKAQVAPLILRSRLENYEIMHLTKKTIVKAARVILCLAALVATHGCATSPNRVTGKSWSQTAAEEDREQRLSNSPQDYWNLLP